MAVGDTLKNYVIGVGVKDNNFTAGLKNMGGQIKSFVSQMGLLMGAGGLGMAFKKFIDTGTDISNFSNLTGIAASDITALGGALERFGGNTESAKKSLLSLQQGLSQAEWGQGNLLEASAMYGIDIFNQDGSMKNAQQLLLGLADDFQNLTKAQQITLGGQLGLDDATILMLQQGKSAVKAMVLEQERMGAMSARDAAEAKKFSLEITKLKQSMGQLGRSIGSSVIPPLIDIAKKLGKALDFVKQLDFGTVMLGAGIVALGWTLKNFQTVMGVFSKSFLKANLPILALVAGLTLLFLILEDIYSWTQGRQSIFGDIMENEKVKKVINMFKDMFAWFQNMDWGSMWDGLMDGIDTALNKVSDFFGTIWDNLKIMGHNLAAFIINPIIDVINKIPTINLEKIEMQELQSFSARADARAQARAANNTQNNSVTVNVVSSGDSLGDVARAAEKGMKEGLALDQSLFTNNVE